MCPQNRMARTGATAFVFLLRGVMVSCMPIFFIHDPPPGRVLYRLYWSAEVTSAPSPTLTQRHFSKVAPTPLEEEMHRADTKRSILRFPASI